MKITMKATLKAAFTGAAMGMIPVLHVSHAQQVVDPAAAAAKQSTLTQSLNGTAVQNIAAPNASGLSHNQFSTFNVNTQGLVINNSNVNAISQIGGAVVANPNLAGGQARLILNEVTSGNRSILQGTQELLGGQAAYILANPNGISCDGCGFINFPRATLTTGSPLFNGDNLMGFRIDGGDVSIGAGGLNATGVDFFDILTRSAQINGQINANDLSLRLGSNDVDYATLTATARAPVGAAPSFALDSSALGGMYAGRISLIGTEAGVGVRMLGNVAASVSDVELDVNGRISMKDNVVGAQRNVTLRSTQLAAAPGFELELDNVQLSAAEQLRLEGGDVQVNGGKAVAGTNLTVDAASLQSTSAQIEARQDVSITTTGAANVSGGTVQADHQLTVNAGAMALASGAKLMGEADGVGPLGGTTVNVTGTLDLTDAALFSGAALNVTAGALNVGAASNAGGTKGLRGTGAVDVNATTITNAGLLASDTTLTLDASGTLTNSGTVYGKTALGLTAGTLSNSHLVESGAALTVDADTVTNTGKLYGQTGVTLTADTLNNSKLVESGAAMTLNVADLNNVSTATSKAELYAVGNLTIQGNHTLDNTASAQHTAAIVSRDGQLGIDSRSGAAGSQAVSNAGGLLFGGNGVSVLVSRLFENKLHAGKRATTFANNGNVLLGAPSQAAVEGAAQDITVVNTDADIEARTGNINIYTSYLRNTTNNVPVVNTGAWVSSGASSYDHDNNPATPDITIEDDCGHYEDHFNKDVVGKVCARWVETRSQTLASPDLSPRGRIIAGNDFTAWIEKEALNYISLISAGNNITLNGSGTAQFENRSVELRHDKNALVFRYENGGEVACAAGQDWCFYDFPSYYRKKFVDISPGVLSTYTVGMASTVQSGGAINVNIGRVTNGSGFRGESQNVTIIPGTGPSSGAPTGGTPGAVPGSGIGTLTGSPFFVPSRNPTSPYLFETDPRLMNLAGLYGSDLFLNSLGLDPTDYLRVGDPYFEQQLLRQQLLAEAGQLFVADGMASENEQFKYLMDNAVAAQDDLQLRVGVALTKEQIANLQKDIVWMVEVEVNGKKALVPQLYLSDTTKASLAQGARFVASNINVKTESEFVNSGAFVASNNLKVDAGTTFTNTGGTLVAANGLNIQAVGDILNQSGTIRGGDVSVTSTEGSIVNETLTATQRFGDQGNVTHLGPTATIESTGNLNLNAKNDIVSRGGNLHAAGDANLTAGRDITLTAVKQETFSAVQESSRAGGHRTTTTTTENITRQVGSGLNVGGNLNATAGNNINIEASTVDVAGGGRLDAGKDINIVALAENRKTETSTSTRSWNSSYEQDTSIDHTTGKASTVNFGGDLAMASGNNTNLMGSQLAVGGDLNVERIGGDLNVTTFEEKLNVTQTTRTSSVFGGEAKADAGKNIAASEVSATGTLFSKTKETTTVDATTHLRSGIAVGGNLNAGEGAIAGNVNITGSNIATGGDMNLKAGGDINMLATNDSVTVETTRSSSSFGVTANASVAGAGVSLNFQNERSNNEVTQTTAQVSGLSAGGNINLDAGGNFREQGTQVAAGGDIGVAAKTITSEAAQNTYTESGSSTSVSVGLGVKAETGLDGLVSSFINPATNKAGFDMAGAAQGINALSAPDPGQVKAELSVTVTKTSNTGSGSQAIASGFNSGGNVSFTARDGDATFHGTNVDAAGSINVTADKGAINILTADSHDTATQNRSETNVTVGVSGDGTVSASGSGERSTATQSSTSQQAASFKAGGDMNLSARDDVTLRGTNLEAGGTASVESREGGIRFEAAQDTTNSSSYEMSAHASVSVNVAQKSGSVGGGGSEMSTRESSTTGKAGSINAGNIVLKSKNDITLVGTNLTAQDSATLQSRDGKVDFQAVQDTHTRTADGWSMDVSVEAGKTGGSVQAGGSRTDEFESSTTRTGGSLTAKNLTISAGSGVRLEGTQVNVSENANIDTGTGALTLEAAVSTSEKRINNTAVEVAGGVDTKEKSGHGSLKAQGERTNENKVTNSNAVLNIGGTADIKAAGGIDIKGKDIAGVESIIQAGTTNLNGANVSIEQLKDVDESSSNKFGVSVGVYVPGKKARDMVADKARSVRDSDTVAAISNKLTNAGAGLSNAADSVKNTVRNVGADAATRAQNNADLAATKQATKDAATATKLDRNNRQADRAATQAETGIKSDQSKKDQKADFDRQQGDDKAARERDQLLARIDPTSATASQERATADKQFEDAKAANQKSAEDAKRKNASDAADLREKALDDIAQRKRDAENKAADSTIRRQEAAGNAEQADALKAAKAERESNMKADTDKAKDDNAAQKQRTDSDFQAQRDADDRIRRAREKQAADDAKADADATLSDAQKQQAKDANAKTAKQAIDDADQKRDDAKRDNAEKAADAQLAARKKQEQARIDAEKAKREALAEAAHQRDAGKDDDTQKKAVADAATALKDAKTQADADLKTAQDKAETDRKDKATGIDADRVAAEKAADQKRDKAVDPARKALDAAKKTSETDRDAALKKIDADTALSDDQKKTAREKANTEHDQRVSDAQKTFDTVSDAADKTRVAEKESAAKDADQKKRTADTEVATAKKDADDARAKAEADAKTAHDDAVAKAKADQTTRLEDRKKAEIAQAAADARHKRELADLDAAEREALAKADREAAQAEVDIDRNGAWTAAQKADRRKAVADKQAAEREKAAQERADKAAAKEQARDDLARQTEVDAIDPQLSAADKTAKQKEIDDKYADRTTERETARDKVKDAATDQRKASEAKAELDLAQRKAQAQADAKRDTDDATASTAHDDAVTRVDDKLRVDSQNKTPDEIARLTTQAEQEKRKLQADRDAATAEHKRIADDARATADADRAKKEAEQAHQRETDRLAALTPPPADLATQKKAADDQRDAARKNADDRLAAQQKDNAATEADTKAQVAREQRDADIDADTALSATEKEQKKKDSERTFLTDQKAAQTEHDAAAKSLEALMTPAEKAAAQKAAEAAEKEGARVKNPYALGTRVKAMAKKGEKWKEVLTSFGFHHTSQLPAEEDEEEPALPLDTLVRLAGQFPIADQGNMLSLLGDADVQKTAAITAALDAMRSEARGETLKALQQQYTGKELGVLTVVQQREALSDLGLELPAGLPSAEVTRRFNAFLDAAVSSLQPDEAQMKAILEGAGVALKKDDDVAKKYQDALSNGLKKARDQASGMGMSAAQVDALVGQLQP
ncbi:hemagglutinin repeat-containing protein [Hydrogenophaga sp. 2FB]|uniref:two-partner secretion domain-containing protein n=1 Tax=Hydrogenophaga sp. 2FB TaxID=2502187 RepID=UPI0010F9EBBC|nr:hemagglutinin repeat-containing protein [Hydrogenophaga sp. 2FB]